MLDCSGDPHSPSRQQPGPRRASPGWRPPRLGKAQLCGDLPGWLRRGLGRPGAGGQQAGARAGTAARRGLRRRARRRVISPFVERSVCEFSLPRRGTWPGADAGNPNVSARAQPAAPPTPTPERSRARRSGGCCFPFTAGRTGARPATGAAQSLSDSSRYCARMAWPFCSGISS